VINEKNKSLGKPGMKTEGTKKISYTGVRWENGVGFIFFCVDRFLGVHARAWSENTQEKCKSL